MNAIVLALCGPASLVALWWIGTIADQHATTTHDRDDPRDLLEPWGGHGDAWPAIAPSIETLIARAEQAEAERDGAYRERAHLTAWLATIHPAVIAPAVDIDEDGWQILYLTVSGRQFSWHIHPNDADLYHHVEHVPAEDPRAQWDGHTTDQKYQTIREMTFSGLRGHATR
ncbi:hypothetical protein ACIQOW_03620 [Kitasatospora sp. NPDC091335]|uniref:hypothetical protein n=1 Tax=Kitasatospora sp. NPDC091335 TaxID=3364085 RepID=UPI0038043516